MPFASAATPMPPGELSVLVIEDDSNLLRTLRDILNRRGYHPLTANSAREGLALVAQELPAVALVDLKLPDMDGVEVIDRLAALSQLTQTIVLTGNASIESALHALRQRTYDYLVKPVPPEKLLTTIDRAGERWQRRRAEEALRQSEERAQLLLEHISDLVMVVDDRLVVRYVSPSVRHLLDYQPSELIGRSCLGVIHPDDAAATEAFLRGAPRGGGPMQAHQLRVRPRTGRLADARNRGHQPGRAHRFGRRAADRPRRHGTTADGAGAAAGPADGRLRPPGRGRGPRLQQIVVVMLGYSEMISRTQRERGGAAQREPDAVHGRARGEADASIARVQSSSGNRARSHRPRRGGDGHRAYAAPVARRANRVGGHRCDRDLGGKADPRPDRAGRDEPRCQRPRRDVRAAAR